MIISEVSTHGKEDRKLDFCDTGQDMGTLIGFDGYCGRLPVRMQGENRTDHGETSQVREARSDGHPCEAHSKMHFIWNDFEYLCIVPLKIVAAHAFFL